MSMTNFTDDKPTITLSPVIKDTELGLLVPGKPDEEGWHTYDLRELQEFTQNLMEWARIPYHIPLSADEMTRHVDPAKLLLPGDTTTPIKIKTLADFTDEERKLYYPFAFVLACLDGNAFRTGHLNSILENGDKLEPTAETISQYIPDAYRIIKANSGTLDEVRELIQNAAK